MDGGIVTLIIAIVIVGVMAIIAMGLTRRKTFHFDKELYQSRFLSVENKLRKENPATYSLAVMNGDKLLDKALTEMGVAGKTMGERLKKCGDKFSNLNAVWRAHKLRNAIAHEDDLEITYRQAAGALEIYKQALKDIGAI